MTPVVKIGKVTEIIGLIIEADGPDSSIGDLCYITSDDMEPIYCEVVGFREDRVLLMPLGSIDGLKAGANVIMPNISPTDIRNLYTLYNNKKITGGESLEGINNLKAMLKKHGYEAVTARGDSLIQ